ncbi:MAG: NUDIX domain-containing protein [Syntrophales bacterium]|nr:NUDIX domain-containing protein [Syntrophales bacterium]MDY0044790.1 NUDIX hydrolase [Syntrophales bacterium]
MKKKRHYCAHCGNALSRRLIEGKERDYCDRCTTVFYENPLPAVSTIVANSKRELLVVKRGKEPYLGMWCLPIGFAESGEDVRDAALRELREEAGLQGEVVRLIDVDTVENDFYGSMAIITYEVRRTGGKVVPGDDAVDACFVPIHELPPLAWESNRKAVDRYMALYRDAWSMADSYRQLFSGMETGELPEVSPNEEKSFLSDVLVRVIDRHHDEISRQWMEDVREIVPDIMSHLNLMAQVHGRALREVQNLLRGKGSAFDYAYFLETGKRFRNLDVPLPCILNAMALSRKSIWTQITKRRILGSPIRIYTTLELNNRIIFIYDRMNYHLSVGYTQ